MPALTDIIARGHGVDCHRPWPRVILAAEAWRAIAGELAQLMQDAPSLSPGERVRRAEAMVKLSSLLPEATPEAVKPVAVILA